MSKVLVTGVAGLPGSHLSHRLLCDGHRVPGIDNLLGGYEDNVPQGVEFHKVNAGDFESMKPLMKGLAAPHEGLSVFSPNVITSHTYNSTVATVSAAVNSSVRRICFVN
jgi:UDP-glucose 4-epimerase